MLARAHIGHSYRTHSNLLKGDPMPECIPHYCALTVKHILIECQCRSLFNLYDAGVLVGLGYRTHSVSGDWVTMHAREFCILCSFLTWVSGTTKSNELQ